MRLVSDEDLVARISKTATRVREIPGILEGSGFELSGAMGPPSLWECTLRNYEGEYWSNMNSSVSSIPTMCDLKSFSDFSVQTFYLRSVG
ncbi:hypothetical protein TNCV_86981 [Trichonephila clavipes]|nr:hypothetical protein TNCV_86981 [Trichonephila clavipes]